MIKALRERARERERAIHLAAQYAQRLAEVLGPLTGILYGSFAHGDFNLGSDIDMIIISDALPNHPLERMDLLYRYVEGEIEPKGYIREEFMKMLQRGNPFATDALRNGVAVVDDGFWKESEARWKE